MSAPYVAIVGSRPDGAYFNGSPEDQERRLQVRALVHDLSVSAPGTVIVSGGAKGVDTWAEQAAADYGLVAVRCIPAWRTGGKGAGFARNAVVVDLCDRLIALWNGRSRGTAHVIELARKAGKHVTVMLPADTAVERA